MRMTNISKENIRIAGKARIEKNLYNDTYFVFLMFEDRCAYVCSKEGPVEYPTQNHAYKAIRRINKDVPVSNI